MKNITKEDILNSEIGKELILDFIRSNFTKTWINQKMPQDLFESFKQEQLKPKLDWEILSFIWNNLMYTKNEHNYVNSFGGHLVNSQGEIHSVKRLSDGVIFTLGDRINYLIENQQDTGRIIEFKINGASIEVYYDTKIKVEYILKSL